MYPQVTMWFIWRVISRPKTIWYGLFPLVRWYVYRTTKAAADRIPIHVSVLYTYVSCKLYVLTRLPNTLCILSMVLFACELLEEADLVKVQYSCSIKLFLNLWPRNYPSWLYGISTGHEYRTSHIVSTKCAIVITLLSQYYVISNHPVMGSIIVNNFRIRNYFPFLCTFYKIMISKHSSFHGVSSVSLEGNLPFFFIDYFLLWYVSQLVTSFWTVFWCFSSTNFGESLHLFYPVLDEGDMRDTISLRIFGVTV